MPGRYVFVTLHVVQLGDGLLEWTSPGGRTYVDRPPPPNTVTFAEPPF
jgi:hypothetical protein